MAAQCSAAHLVAHHTLPHRTRIRQSIRHAPYASTAPPPRHNTRHRRLNAHRPSSHRPGTPALRRRHLFIAAVQETAQESDLREDARPQDDQLPGEVVTQEQDIGLLKNILPEQAPTGSWLEFEGGAQGIILYHREPVCYAYILDGGTVTRGEKALCPRGDKAGMVTNEAMWGAVVNPLSLLVRFNGEREGDKEGVKEILREPPDIPSRVPISFNAPTGITAVDAFTAIGRGQSMLVLSEDLDCCMRACLTTLHAQNTTDSYCVYCLTRSQTEKSSSTVINMVQELPEEHRNRALVGIMGSQSGLAGRFLALAGCCAMAERVSDDGGHILLMVDDLSSLEELWEVLNEMYATFMRDEWIQPSYDEGEAVSSDGADSETNGMTEVDGMLVPLDVAEHRKFISMLLQRAAQLNDAKGRGSLTIFGSMGACAETRGYAASANDRLKPTFRGDAISPEEIVAKYENISEAQREKLLAALRAKMDIPASEKESAGVANSTTKIMSATVVEEFKSLSDGHMYISPLKSQNGSNQDAFIFSCASSLSRIGAPGACIAMKDLGTSELRLQMMQSDDEMQYGAEITTTLTQRLASKTAKAKAVIAKHFGVSPKALWEQVIELFVLFKGPWLESVEVADVADELDRLKLMLKDKHPHFIQEIEAKRAFPPELQGKLHECLDEIYR